MVRRESPGLVGSADTGEHGAITVVKKKGFNFKRFARSLRPELIEKMSREKTVEDSKDTGRLPYRAAARLRARSADTEERLP